MQVKLSTTTQVLATILHLYHAPNSQNISQSQEDAKVPTWKHKSTAFQRQQDETNKKSVTGYVNGL